MKKSLVSMLILFFIGLQGVLAQGREVSGVVTSAEDGLSIPGVSVIIKGTTIGTTTNLDGKYSLNVPQGENTLVFSFVGMTTQELAITGSTLNVVMESESIGMDEVVVTGYGVSKKAAFTGAATTVSQEKIAEKTDPNPIKALEGTVAGLQLSTDSGQPGAPSTIFVRGRGSLNSGTQPLYVIDGVPMESGTLGMRSDEGAESSPLASLNPADIESITVLKDATATSIYGARAANGVIVINTKSAKAGAKTKVTLSVKAGWEEMPSFTDDYKTVNADKYIELQKEGIVNTGWWGDITPADAEDIFYNSSVSGLTAYDLGITKENQADVNWLDEVTRSGKIQEYNLSIQSSGKDEKAPKYYLSIGYLDNEAMMKGKDFEKYSFRLNIDQKPISWLKYGVNTSLSYTQTNMGASGGYFSDPVTQAYMQAPITPVKDANGDWNFNTVNGYNPVAQRSSLGDKSNAKNYRAIISPFVTVNLTPELSFTSRGGLDLLYLDEFGYWSFLQPQGNDMRGMGEDGVTRQSMVTLTNTMNYIKTINEDHHLNLLLGQEVQKTHQYSTYLSGSNYPVPDKNNVSLAATPGSASTSEYDLKLASFFSSVQYDFQNKYYLSGSYRYDASSRFGSENQWAGFWSVGAKYRLTQEDFMSSTSDWLDDLTVRSSFGTSGNQSVGDGWYAARSLYGYGYNYNSNGGSSREQVGNPDLKWEQIEKFNVGIDARFLNRFSLTLDYYVHNTKDMVFDMPLSYTSGMGSLPKNIGELENKGIEVSINARVLNTEDFSWDVTLVGSKNENKIKKLSTDYPIEGTYTIVEPGKDIYTFKMKEWAGVNPDDGSGLWYLNETGDETTSNYNAAAKRYLGSSSPDFSGSFSSNMKYKNFDFSFQLNYSLGGQIYGNNLRYDEGTGNSYNNTTTNYVYDNRWTTPGQITDVPKFVWGGNGTNSHSSRYLMDGDYLKIQNVVVGYTLPKSITNKMKIGGVRVYASATNLYTFAASNYRGFDPAGIGPNGVQWWNYPAARKFLFGLNVNF
ncbi:SusC/RagA family TonB-linked outer membrane protein [Marinifilum sp. RC60d5]|uniref:SusC/RagA family TonB-linked outer membrane protein n=1 Tax=Marinifilum sp. RC60d5 TaxID=3458414 RepID=UPI0040351A75